MAVTVRVALSPAQNGAAGVTGGYSINGLSVRMMPEMVLAMASELSPEAGAPAMVMESLLSGVLTELRPPVMCKPVPTTLYDSSWVLVRLERMALVKMAPLSVAATN